MRDVIYILLTLGFFALAYAYISGCARVLGPEPAAEGASSEAEPQPEVLR